MSILNAQLAAQADKIAELETAQTEKNSGDEAQLNGDAPVQPRHLHASTSSSTSTTNGHHRHHAYLVMNGNGYSNGNGTAVANTNGLSSDSTLPVITNGNGNPVNGNGVPHRVDLLAEISSLKVKLATAENSSRDWEAKFAETQVTLK